MLNISKLVPTQHVINRVDSSHIVTAVLALVSGSLYMVILNLFIILLKDNTISQCEMVIKLNYGNDGFFFTVFLLILRRKTSENMIVMMKKKLIKLNEIMTLRGFIV